MGGERRAGECETAHDRHRDAGADRPVDGHGDCERGVQISMSMSGAPQLAP